MNKTLYLLIGMAAGAAAGAVGGILFAPNKGSRTRKKIMRKTQKMTHEISDTVHHKLNEIEDQVTMLKKKVEKEIKDTTDHLKKAVRHTNNVGKKVSAN